MSTSSDAAELSTLRAQVVELTLRVTALTTRYGPTPDSLVAADLFAAERSLRAAGRSLERAGGHLGN